jgi:hypothetical protein
VVVCGIVLALTQDTRSPTLIVITGGANWSWSVIWMVVVAAGVAGLAGLAAGVATVLSATSGVDAGARPGSRRRLRAGMANPIPAARRKNARRSPDVAETLASSSA